MVSSSTAKTFRKIKSPVARKAFVEAHLKNGVAFQIKTLRQQRGWTQADLAKKLGTTQATVSRIEDPSYGKYSVSTLLEIGHAFDVALFVRYLPFTRFSVVTKNVLPAALEVESFEQEAANLVESPLVDEATDFEPLSAPTEYLRPQLLEQVSKSYYVAREAVARGPLLSPHGTQKTSEFFEILAIRGAQ